MVRSVPRDGPRPLAGLSQIAASFDLILCDVWGVVHDGERAFGAPAAALSTFRGAGGTVVLLTNAPRPGDAVLAHLDELAVPRAAFDAVVTSGDATAALIAARGSAPLFHLGPSHNEPLFDDVARETGLVPTLARVEDASFVVCTAFGDAEHESVEAYTPVLETLRARDLDMICVNPDLVVHIGQRLFFCAGAVARRYEAIGGRALYAGKPHAPIYDRALALAARLRGRPVARDRVLAIGDGLDTDIAGARRQGFKSLFVTSGIHRGDAMVPREVTRIADFVTGALAW